MWGLHIYNVIHYYVAMETAAVQHPLRLQPLREYLHLISEHADQFRQKGGRGTKCS